ncbi:MAG: aconitate hydratase, partial [Planctomycetes bacterium]|nr:aconitate hydratase [Planctomycetota bacterium]
MGGGAFYITAPKVIGVKLTGELQPWVAAKDVILHLLSILTTKGNVGCIVEYFGEGVETLSVPQRATITNMGAELGVTTSVFPSDKRTKAFLKSQDRVDEYVALAADDGAKYDRVITINLSKVLPLTAAPSSPDNIKKVKEMKGTEVQQVLVGSCTNSSYRDLMTVATIMKGQTVHPNVEFGIAPGSRQVLEMISKKGALADLIACGARILESGCGPCIGQGFSPGSDKVTLRTFNRNFNGRSGTKNDKAYLVSPETAAAAALTGYFIDPRQLKSRLDMEYPEIKEPGKALIDDRLI